jgi:type IV pilus assembly protein PilF
VRRLLPLVLAAALLAAGCAQTGGPSLPDLTPAPAQYTPNPQPAQETDLQYRARLHTELGANYYARGQFDVALEELNEAIRLVPTYASAHGVLGLLQMDLGEFDKAEASFKRAIQLAPQDPEIRNNYGWFLCQRRQEREGLAQFDLALRNPLYRTPELALLNAGRCHLRLNELPAAEASFRKVLGLQPGNPKAFFGLAEIAYRQGRYANAQTLMRTALQAPQEPETLYLAACTERRLGNPAAADALAAQMRALFPEAGEIKQLDAGICP